jgi:hypothetical protein
MLERPPYSPMKTKTAGLTLAFSLLAGAVFGAGSEMGTWKLNEAKSKFAPGAPKNRTVVYAQAGDKVKVTVDGIDGAGKATHNVWTGKFDGRDYAVKGDPTYNMRSYRQVNDRTLEMTLKHGAEIVGTGRIVISADGKSRTVTTKMKDKSGKEATTKAVYDKSA